jgi:hypothetical protein
MEYITKEEFEAYKEQRCVEMCRAEGTTQQIILNNQRVLNDRIQTLTDIFKMYIEKIIEQIPEVDKEYLKIETGKKWQEHIAKRKELNAEHYDRLIKLNPTWDSLISQNTID